MNSLSNLRCPVCDSNNFVLRYQSTFVYSYIIDSDAPGLNNHDEFLSFLYDSREQKEAKQYIECISCGTKYLYESEEHPERRIDSTSLHSVVDIKNIIGG